MIAIILVLFLIGFLATPMGKFTAAKVAQGVLVFLSTFSYFIIAGVLYYMKVG